MNAQLVGMRALEFRDYFYLHNWPESGDEKVWRRIECASQRIVAVDYYLHPNQPSSVRLAEATCLRRAARECADSMAKLKNRIDPWTFEAVIFFLEVAENVFIDLESHPSYDAAAPS